MHGLDLILRGLSGMDAFVFQPGGGAHAAYTHAVITRAYHAARGELAQRDEVVTTIQAHPVQLGDRGRGGLQDRHAPARGERLSVARRAQGRGLGADCGPDGRNPDDMGVYNPEIDKWVEVVHDAGGLCFYDHANFNGVMGKIKARELGFDACMYMLHKTFGAPKAGGGPAVGAYGCTAELARFLPEPSSCATATAPARPRPARLCRKGSRVLGKRAAARLRVHLESRDGRRRNQQAADISVLANNYMETRLLAIRGVTKSQPHLTAPRLEMTRYSLEAVERETGITVFDVQNRMVDFGIDAFWLSHEPWLVPAPFTPEAGEMWSKEDSTSGSTSSPTCRRGLLGPGIVRTAPHNQAIRRLGAADLNDPASGRRRGARTSASGAVARGDGDGRSRRSDIAAAPGCSQAVSLWSPAAPAASAPRSPARSRAKGAPAPSSISSRSGSRKDGSPLTADVTAEADVEGQSPPTSSASAALTRRRQRRRRPAVERRVELDLAALDRTLAVNVRGVAATIKHGARRCGRTGGSIVVMASLNAWHAVRPGATRRPNMRCSDSFARRRSTSGRCIRVNAIGPGPVATERSASA